MSTFAYIWQLWQESIQELNKAVICGEDDIVIARAAKKVKDTEAQFYAEADKIIYNTDGGYDQGFSEFDNA